MLSAPNGNMLPKVPPLSGCYWPCGNPIELSSTGGYTTFAQNAPDAQAFSYVHGKGEYDAGATWVRAPFRLRYGGTGRDFSVYVSNCIDLILIIASSP